jgi:hypothetical protein
MNYVTTNRRETCPKLLPNSDGPPQGHSSMMLPHPHDARSPLHHSKTELVSDIPWQNGMNDKRIISSAPSRSHVMMAEAQHMLRLNNVLAGRMDRLTSMRQGTSGKEQCNIHMYIVRDEGPVMGCPPSPSIIHLVPTSFKRHNTLSLNPPPLWSVFHRHCQTNKS